MPRSEAEEISNKVQTIIQTQYDPDLQFYTMGSFRRGLPTCGDIDIISSWINKYRCIYLIYYYVKMEY